LAGFYLVLKNSAQREKRRAKNNKNKNQFSNITALPGLLA
jgi:hypothetical protein